MSAQTAQLSEKTRHSDIGDESRTASTGKTPVAFLEVNCVACLKHYGLRKLSETCYINSEKCNVTRTNCTLFRAMKYVFRIAYYASNTDL